MRTDVGALRYNLLVEPVNRQKGQTSQQSIEGDCSPVSVDWPVELITWSDVWQLSAPLASIYSKHQSNYVAQSGHGYRSVNHCSDPSCLGGEHGGVGFLWRGGRHVMQTLQSALFWTWITEPIVVRRMMDLWLKTFGLALRWFFLE